jgi:HEAT repeat protein
LTDPPSFKDFLRASQVRAALGIDPLLPLLQHGHPGRRKEAVTALGLSGDLRAVPHLREILKDPDSRVVASAAIALQNLGDASACDVLAEAARHPDTVAAVSAIGAMAALHCPQTVPSACERLETETNADGLRRILAELHGIRDPQLVEAARKLLTHLASAVRIEAALRMAESDHPDALPVLARALYHPSAAVRDAAQVACASLAPLHLASWPLAHAGWWGAVTYDAWRQGGGHVYFQSVG